VPRTEVRDALVLRRHPLPSGDVIATLLSPDGKWRAIARKGRLPGGNLARLSLFHDVTVQVWHRRDDDLALITQVRLNGALSGLSRPNAYPYAHLLAELADVLTAEQPMDERGYALLASGLRGLHAHNDPEAVALAYAWRLLRLAGVHPAVRVCAACGGVPTRLQVAAGRAYCDSCNPGSGDTDASPTLMLGAAGMGDLQHLLLAPLADAVATPPTDRASAWRVMRAFVRWHIGVVRAFEGIA
jgi:DNA repair protein RecO (recombination protein O)